MKIRSDRSLFILQGDRPFYSIEVDRPFDAKSALAEPARGLRQRRGSPVACEKVVKGDRPFNVKKCVSEARPYGGCANEEDRPFRQKSSLQSKARSLLSRKHYAAIGQRLRVEQSTLILGRNSI